MPSPPCPPCCTVTAQGNNAALKDGDGRSRAASALDFEEVPVLVQGFRRMVRGLEFDVCEMALTTYLVARAHGVAFTALPVFLVRGFHHGAIRRSPASDIRGRATWTGRRVGVNRGYTVTTGVWARVDPARTSTASTSTRSPGCCPATSTCEAYRPAGERRAGPGRPATLDDLLRDGELGRRHRRRRRRTPTSCRWSPTRTGPGSRALRDARALPDQPPGRGPRRPARGPPRPGRAAVRRLRPRQAAVRRPRCGPARRAPTPPTGCAQVLAEHRRATRCPTASSRTGPCSSELLRARGRPAHPRPPGALEDLFAPGTRDLIA